MSSQYKAFTTLITVIVITIVATVLVVSSIVSNTESFLNQASLESSNIARNNSLSCMEIALDKLKTSLIYTGNETITLQSGECSIETITGVGNTNRIVTTSSTFKNFSKKFQVTVTEINPILKTNQILEIN